MDRCSVWLVPERLASAQKLLKHVIGAGDNPFASDWSVVLVRIHLASWFPERGEVVHSGQQPVLEVFVSCSHKLVKGMNLQQSLRRIAA